MPVPATTAPTESARPWGPWSPRGLWQRFGHLVHEVGKFGVVGAATFVVDVTISNLLLRLVGPYVSAAISMTIAASLAFIGNRYWTWRHRERSQLHREYLLYFGFNLVGFVIGLGCLWIDWNLLGHFWPDVFRSRLAYNISKNLIGTGLGTCFRFWSYRRFVFPAVAQEPASEVAA